MPLSAHATRIRLGLIWFGVAGAVLGILCLSSAGVLAAYGRLHQNQMFPGVRVLGVRLDGMTMPEARTAVEEALDRARAEGLRFQYGERLITLDSAAMAAAGPDTSRDFIRFSIDQALERAFTTGREGNWLTRGIYQLRLRTLPANIPAEIVIDRPAIEEALQVALKNELVAPQDATFVIDTSKRPAEVRIQAERPGKVLLTEAAFRELEEQAADLDFSPIALSDRAISPERTSKDLLALQSQVEALFARPALSFTYASQTFAVPSTLIAGWVAVTGTRGSLALTLDVTALQRDLPIIAPQVEKAAKEGSLVITDGRITSFVGGTAGLMIDVEAMRQSILTDWSITTSTLPLLVRVIPAKLAGEDPKRLGIHELIGVGRSNFSGSPTNRRKNIAHGVELVHATILQPGEEFSLLKTLGPIDEEHKWLPELVIKGNKTLPEFGGGLCQIGTTVFRGALDSGLPIVERQNHSYRVRYYEPAGTDATIYDPKPDFRFLNDTGAPILINGYIEKNDEVVFEFWGTKDGRVSERTDPRIYNVTAPPATKLIETLDLEPGKKKCTETAHAGADAEFTYTVTYANGEVKKEVFRSHYRPWQAVCLIGVEKLSTPSDTSAGEIPLDPAAATSSHP